MFGGEKTCQFKAPVQEHLYRRKLSPSGDNTAAKEAFRQFANYGRKFQMLYYTG